MQPLFNHNTQRDRTGTLLTAFLVVTIAAGAYMRVADIGRYGFWTDELFHVFAAESYLRDGTLDVPWDEREYTRALPVTLLTALAFSLFGQDEATARIFFAVANIVFILIAYQILKRFLSRDIALIFAAASSFSTFSIQMSQECRMYTLFQLFYFLMSIAFFVAIEPAAAGHRWRSLRFLQYFQLRTAISFGHLLLAAVLAIAAVSLHELTFTFVLVPAFYCAAMVSYTGYREGLSGLLRSKYASFSAVLLAAALLFSLAPYELPDRLVRRATELPPWQLWTDSNLAFYRRVIAESHPILWVIFPVGAFIAIRTFGRFGLYLVLSFVIPFIFHCFVFQRVAERYIFHVLPFFVAVSSIGFEFLLRALMNGASKWSQKIPPWREGLFRALIAVTSFFLVYSGVHRADMNSSVAKFVDWKNLNPATVQTVIGGPVATTDRYGFNYYFGRYPDFVIDVSDVEHVGGPSVLTNLDEFQTALGAHPGLYVVTHLQHLNHAAFVSEEIRDYLLRELDRVGGEDEQRIMIFRGRLTEHRDSTLVL